MAFTPNGKVIVIDLGAGLAGGYPFSPLQHLKEAGWSNIDHVTITHPHLDHIDDILNFDSVSPRTLLWPKHLTERDIRGANPELNANAEAKVQKYLEISRIYTADADPADNLYDWSNWGEVSIRSFVPWLSSHSNLNNHSIVTAIEYERVKVLIPGDNEPASWSELLKKKEFVDTISGTHVLVASHHGRESGFYAPLFDHFFPYITIISDGRVVGTSVTSKYTERTHGRNVQKRSGGYEFRKCVTTRNDGCIEVEIDRSSGAVGTLKVLID